MVLTNKKHLFSIIFLCIFINLNAKTVEQFFIKITPNQNLVNCGKLKIKKAQTKFDFFVQNNKVDIIKPAEALAWINDSILKNNSENTKILFFIHGFWGSLPFAVHRTAKEFDASYFKNDSANVKAIVHIIWDANDISYKQTQLNLKNSIKTLADLLNNIKTSTELRYSLMCHSMGNRFFYTCILKEKVSVHFEQLILMAPDLDYRKFEKNHNLFSNLANTVDLFYHKKDQTLNMSKRINKIERLGRLDKSDISADINFIDCTSIKDINSLSDSVMRHLYFLTSKTVKKRVENILKN